MDSRKPLPVLHNEWSSCQACSLGQRRAVVGGHFVAGEGVPRGILFIGEGPGRVEEDEGRPFVGKSGALIRDALEKLRFTHYYITNLVTCRSCEPIIDPTTGAPKLRKRNGRPDEIIFRDGVPKPDELEACRPRLWEEIYIVDPILIVTLGNTASEAILQRRIAITNERGRTEHAVIPGATFRAMHTDKRGVWGRKIQGEMRFPTERNEVRYLVLPTLHPAYVLRRLGDRGANSPILQFADDMRRAVKIYQKYMVEVLGVDHDITPDADLSSIGMEPYYESDEGEAGP